MTDDASAGGTATDELVEALLDGDHRALARAISKIENREPGYRDLVAALHRGAGDARVVGVTGSPGAGKSTLVDKLAEAYRDRGLTVGIIAIDPSSPFSGGAVLGDRIRMASTVGDMDVFVRSMSARGTLGGLATATTDAVTALDAFGKDRIVIETVGAGQNEIDVVRAADTVAVLVPPGSGDDVQMLKAGILEIADLFVVNKADLDGADRTVQELREMLEYGRDAGPQSAGHHGAAGAISSVEGQDGASGGDDGNGAENETGNETRNETGNETRNETGNETRNETGNETGGNTADGWRPPIVETVATTGDGLDAVLEALDGHRAYLEASGTLTEVRRARYAESIRTLLREDLGDVLEAELERRGGFDAFVERVVERETDPYAVADELVGPIRECVEERRERD